MKKAKEHAKKPVHVAPDPVHGTEPEKMDVAPIPAPEVPEIKESVSVEVALKDQWRHHATEESRIFRIGEVIPEGWAKHPVVKTV